MADQSNSSCQVVVDGLDMSDMAIDVRYFEDIFSNFVTAAITVVDTRGILFTKPLFGEETVVLSMSNMTGTIRKTLKIFKISDVSSIKQNTYQYTLHVCSPELIANAATRVSKAYQSKKASEIVRLLMTEPYPYGLNYSGPLNIEASFYDEYVIVPYWSPFEAINWLAGRAVTEANHNAANFLFFENASGYNFASLETLLAKPPKVEITTIKEGLNSRTVRQNNAREFSIVKHNNVITNITNGLYAGRLVTHDVATKEIKVYEYDYRNDFNAVKSLESSPYIRSSSQLPTMTTATHRKFELSNKVFDNMPEDGFKPDKFLLQRMSQLTAINAFRIAVQIGGNLALRVGDVANLDLQTPTGTEGTEKNRIYSGKYLISSLKHVYINDEIHTILELGRDSLPTSLA